MIFSVCARCDRPVDFKSRDEFMDWISDVQVCNSCKTRQVLIVCEEEELGLKAKRVKAYEAAMKKEYHRRRMAMVEERLPKVMFSIMGAGG